MDDPRYNGLVEPPPPPLQAEPEPTGIMSVLNIATSRQGAAAIAFVAVGLLVLWIQPPMVLQDISTNEYRREYTVRWWVLLAWASVAAVIVFFAAPIMETFRSQGAPPMQQQYYR